ncbi:MAG: hypothetical protein H6767_05840 [Candidatus Peribacteria bacterium]|nr:MAG: hypothetical protein H6767_05840 [Candidatus Peribacteria bacterium]
MIDEIGKTLSPYEDLLINFGGDIWVGNTPKTIGLEDPYDPTRIIGKIRILQM